MIKNRLKSRKIKLAIISKTLIVLMIIVTPKVLLSQDKISAPPVGYDSYKADIIHGKNDIITYYSSTASVYRKTRIYLPPGYTKDSTYNVLYLLHGIGGDVNEWYNNGVPHRILDNLYAEGKIAPMIVVLPNGRAMADDSPGSNIYAADKVAGFANFEFELIKDLIPFIDSVYSLKAGREARAIAGLSMGGGQALNFGLAHLDTFAWVGAFSPAPNTKPANQLIPNLEQNKSKISALWISCGTSDGLLYISQNTRKFMAQNNIKHYYLEEPGKGHDWSVWKPGLYHFTQRIFGRTPKVETDNTGIIPPESKSELNFSYNPVNQTISFQGNYDFKKINIYDLNGRLLFSNFKISNNTLNISWLQKGIYLFVINNTDRNFHCKIIK